MASLGKKFDATAHDTTQRDFQEEVPNGIYALEMEASSVDKTSKGTGQILKTTLSVIEPEEFKGRKIFNNNYNLENDSPKAQELGQRQFAALCRAIGVSDVDDSEELHFRRFIAKVAIGKPSTGKDGTEYPGRAEIKRYYFPDEGDLPPPAIDENQPEPPKAKPAANDNRQAANTNRPAQTAAPAATKRPWGK